MKKILIASTALVSTAGIAAADVALSGRAEMGVFKTNTVDAQFFTDIDVTFTMSGETDNGLTFGASVDLDEGGDGSDASDNNAEDGGATIFISGSFGTVTMGDTDGALDWALTEAGNVGNPGSLADDETEHAGYNGAYGDGAYDGQILRYDYSSGDFGVAVSFEIDDAGVQDMGYAIGLKYNLDLGGTTVALGAGYQSYQATATTALKGVVLGAGTEVDIIGVSASASWTNGLSAGVQYSDWDIGGVGVDHVGIGAGYTTGAFSIHANYGKFDVDGGGESDGFGIAAAYDLGGGAVVHLGYGDGNTFANADVKTVSLGLGLSF